ncbi:MAG TPA: family 20 glycosylhydrolase [Rheinheimera sp.]|nr:family 20 glycosylhydrolase [Rheinheimera sp.]
MRWIPIFLLLCIPLSLRAALNQTQLAQFASQAQLQFSVQSNLLPEPMRFSGAIDIYNGSNIALTAKEGDWQIYFHFIRRIEPMTQHGLMIEPVQGDLHRIRPTADFAGLAPQQRLSVTFESAPWMASYTDFMPRAFIVAAGLSPEIFSNTNTEDLQQFVKPLETAEQLSRNFAEADQVPIVDAARRYATNQSLNAVAKQLNSQHRIIPTPSQAAISNETLQLTAHWQIRFAADTESAARFLQQAIAKQGLALGLRTDTEQDTNQTITLSVDNTLALTAEGYQLSITDTRIGISGKDKAGVFYAVQSLLALLQTSGNELLLPLADIKDQPRAPWRGMHYDMARNFHGKDVTLRLIDNMARYKLNKLHLHLTDDEGWRLQIPALPELTEIGAKRCFDLTEQQCLLTQLGTGPFANGTGNGFYSSADFIEILRYAAERHIEVIPEIDFPGHARAAIVAMKARYNRLVAAGDTKGAEHYLLSDPADTSSYLSVQNYTDNSANVCLDSTYQFIDTVLHELQHLYQQAGLTLTTYHMGGDEVAKGSWVGSPACQQLISNTNSVNAISDLKAYFVSRVARLTQQYGLTLAGWEDGLMYDQLNTFERDRFGTQQVIANAWDNIWEWGVADRAYRLANNGYKVVLSPGTHLYFDHPHEANPQERGYYWATRFISLDKAFGFMPDNLYANADTTRSGAPISDLPVLVGRALPALEQPQNILGIQGQLWSETVRTAEQLEQMIYPRMLALAERAWHKAAWEESQDNNARLNDWQSFAHRVSQVELNKLQSGGSSFYLPPPGAMVKNGQLHFNSSLPELTTECSADAGKHWQVCAKTPLQQSTEIWLRHRKGQVLSREINLLLK